MISMDDGGDKVLQGGSRGRAFWHFCLDLLMAVLMMFGLSLVMGVLWAGYMVVAVGGMGGDVQEAVKNIGEPGVLAQTIMTVLGGGTAATVLYFWRRRADGAELRGSLEAILRWGTWGWMLCVCVLIFLFGLLVSYVGVMVGVEAEPTNQLIIQQGMRDYPLWMCLFVVVLAPLYEEVLFRRVLFGRLWAVGMPWLGIMLSGLLFALVHELPGMGESFAVTLQLWVMYGFIGMCLAWVYYKTGTLWAPIGVHAVNNGGALLVLYFGL